MTEFASPSDDKKVWETTDAFTPRFGPDGLITAVTIDHQDNTVLMVAYMNAQSLSLTLETGIAHYWSRSRNALWKKGETSGNTQRVIELRTDCDQDVIVIAVETGDTGANCHTGRKSCFYRIASRDEETGTVKLVFDETDIPRFDPDKVYK